MAAQKKYFLLAGEYGLGKTCLIKKVAGSVIGGGIIYVACPANPLHFGQSFAVAINYASIYKPSMYRIFLHF